MPGLGKSGTVRTRRLSGSQLMGSILFIGFTLVGFVIALLDMLLRPFFLLLCTRVDYAACSLSLKKGGALFCCPYDIHKKKGLPGSFNLKWSQAFAFAGIKIAPLDGIHAAAARSFGEQRLQVLQLGFFAHRNHFHVTALRIAHPTAQTQRCGLAMHKPAKAHALHAAFDEVIADHSGERSVLQSMPGSASRGM